MTTAQWARVLRAGSKQMEHFTSPLCSAGTALGAALEAMADEAMVISREEVKRKYAPPQPS